MSFRVDERGAERLYCDLCGARSNDAQFAMDTRHLCPPCYRLATNPFHVMFELHKLADILGNTLGRIVELETQVKQIRKDMDECLSTDSDVTLDTKPSFSEARGTSTPHVARTTVAGR